MCSHPYFHNSTEYFQKYTRIHIPKTSRYTEVSIYTLPSHHPLPSLPLFRKKVRKGYYRLSTSMSNLSFPPYPRHRWLGMGILLSIHTDDYQPFMCILAYFRRYRLPFCMCRLPSIRKAYFKVSFCLLHQVNLSKLPRLHFHPHLSRSISRSINSHLNPSLQSKNQSQSPKSP